MYFDIKITYSEFLMFGKVCNEKHYDMSLFLFFDLVTHLLYRLTVGVNNGLLLIKHLSF